MVRRNSRIATQSWRCIAATMALIAGPLPTLANPGHNNGHAHGAHPRHGGYDGHAAALGEPGDPKAKARIIHVTMSDEMRFAPATISVVRGETIRFVVRNAGELKHEMTLGTMAELTEHAARMEASPDMEHDEPNSVTVAPGSSKTILWKFTKAGSFDFACLIPGHLQGGMKGKIVVR